ncbi:MAG: hypothetical protein KatS3mg121_0466 [Gammaproteobacteria bacterium]|nr:MAG: hypothetical protein KatS3mg121_0466 [Gammaproteobacteria bacterium]
MHILLVSRSGRRRHQWDLRSPAVAAGLLAVVLGLMGGGALLGHRLALQSVQDRYLLAWAAELEAQRAAVRDLREQAQARVEALTARVGQMQAHITRLNALGDKLVKLAKLDPEEFEFDQSPAVGGPAEEAAAEAVPSADLDTLIEDLGRELGDREYQLFVLEEVLRSRLLQEAVHPAGRPVHKGWISSYFGYRNDPFTGRREFHKGIDIAGKAGTEIVAVAGGLVTWAGRRWGYGNLVEINHGNGYVTRYGHCEKVLVKEGEAVKKGQVVGLMGSTGRSTGPHVHFEVLHNGRQVDPLDFIYAAR